MPYQESASECNCDWCGNPIPTHRSVACKSCMEKLEQENQELKREIERLRDKISALIGVVTPTGIDMDI